MWSQSLDRDSCRSRGGNKVKRSSDKFRKSVSSAPEKILDSVGLARSFLVTGLGV
jgi:hypothetical protein